MECFHIKVNNVWSPLTKELYFKLMGTKVDKKVSYPLERNAKINRFKHRVSNAILALLVLDDVEYQLRDGMSSRITDTERDHFLFGMINAWELDDPYYVEIANV